MRSPIELGSSAFLRDDAGWSRIGHPPANLQHRPRPLMTFPNGPALDRRGFLKLAGLSWLTPVGRLLAEQAERTRQPAQSIILLWLDGGPSQLETFDPHPDTKIAAGTQAIASSVPGIQLAAGYEHLAEQMGSVALIR